MICGSCLHDNTLAGAHRARGVDIQLVPTYTPIRTDEPDVSTSQVFFGGLNVYFEQKIPGYARLPRWLTGWLDRPGLLRGPRRSASRPTAATSARSPFRSSAANRDGSAVKSTGSSIGSPLSRAPTCIHFTNLLIGGCIPTLKSRLGCPVVVTLQGDDIFLDSLPDPTDRKRSPKCAASSPMSTGSS